MLANTIKFLGAESWSENILYNVTIAVIAKKNKITGIR